MKSFADFVAKSGMDLIQILPINDTTTFMDWRDSYPYGAISVFALHPIYFDMADIRQVLTDAEKVTFDAQQKTLNALDAIDYEAVLAGKWHYIKLGYEKLSKTVFASHGFSGFLREKSQLVRTLCCFLLLENSIKPLTSRNRVIAAF